MCDQIIQYEIIHLLTIGCCLCLFALRCVPEGCVKVALPHQQRIKAKCCRNVIHDPFHSEHALRATKAAKGGGGLRIGPQTVAFDPNIGKEIGIVSMQHCAVSHRQAQVERPSTTCKMSDIQRCDPPRVIKANVVIDAEIMPLAGDDHIIVTVIAHFASLAGQPCRNRAAHGQRVALAFLAAKATAHAAGLNPD